MSARAALLATASALVVAAGASASAGASTFFTNVTTDTSGPTSCPGIVGAPCTLRAALTESAADPGPDTIELIPGTYELAQGPLNVRAPVTIEGQGTADATVLDAQSGPRIFDVRGTTATLAHLTLTGAAGDPALVASDVRPLVLSDVVVRDNVGNADSGPGGLSLGGATGTTAVIANSVLARNIGATAGAIALEPSAGNQLDLHDSELRDNVAFGLDATHDGGALQVAGGSVAIARSRLASNHAPAGGAIAIVPGPASAASVAVTVTDSTFDDNRATIGAGGAVSVDAAGPAARSFTARSDTFAGNSAAGGGGALGGALGDISLGNSVLARSSGGACAGVGVPASAGHDLADDRSCALAGPGDRQGIDPLLGSVADNGGPTFTALPLPGSPLIDAAEAGACTATDQRGIARPQGAGCDIGAAELVPSAPASGPPPGGPSGSPSPPPPPAPPVRVSALHLAPRVVVGKATLTWRASAAGHVRFTVTAKRGKRIVTVTRFTLRSRSGANRALLPAKVLGRLRAGDYRLEAVSAANPRVTPTRATFRRAVRRRR